MNRITLTLVSALSLVAFIPASQSAMAQSVSQSMEQASYTDAELDSLLAPIALYPDSLLTHIFIASTYPLEVVAADRWRQNNLHLTAEEAEVAVDDFDWDPSVKALVPFAQVLQTMADDLDWLQSLGDNVLISQERVLARVQVLRGHAMRQGNLNDNDYMTVERDQEVIVIEPRRQEIVYVPYYDTRVVYGPWWHPVHPVFWHHPVNYRPYAGFYWGPSIRLSTFFYFGGIHWHDRYVVVNRSPVRHYYRGSRIKRVYSREYQRWDHDRHHRRVSYSHRVVNSHPDRYKSVETKERRKVDYRADSPRRGYTNQHAVRNIKPVRDFDDRRRLRDEVKAANPIKDRVSTPKERERKYDRDVVKQYQSQQPRDVSPRRSAEPQDYKRAVEPRRVEREVSYNKDVVRSKPDVQVRREVNDIVRSRASDRSAGQGHGMGRDRGQREVNSRVRTHDK